MANFRQVLEQRKGQEQQVNLDLTNQCLAHAALQVKHEHLEQAQVVIQAVALLTQDSLKYHVAELVTLALTSIFDDPYELEMDFVQRRNQTEADIFFVRDGERVDPLTASGGGAVDVAAFALRVSLWSLKNPRTRPVLVLDEPFRFISMNYRTQTSEMLKMVSERLKLQIVMVTHSEELAEVADKVITISQKKGISKVSK
jgi:DNA repair exonuclease SbcCD ATPase subunit